eukprot:m.86948 g.86948  ORF g.86948 m.86948 type:complete len:71 (+) comp16380_c1_seq11:2219-2431(+)
MFPLRYPVATATPSPTPTERRKCERTIWIQHMARAFLGFSISLDSQLESLLPLSSTRLAIVDSDHIITAT